MKIYKSDNDYTQEIEFNITPNNIGFSEVSITYRIFCSNPLVELADYKGKNTAKLYIDNELCISYEGNMDFTDGKVLDVGTYSFKVYSDKTILKKVKTEWHFNKSQIKESPMYYDLLIPVVHTSKPSISFDTLKINNEDVKVIYNILNDYSHIDYKLNDSGWVTVRDNPFIIKLNPNTPNYLVLRAYNEDTGFYGLSETRRIN